ncbi:MAG: hypothetical protein LIP10_12245 [Clostridiales bacterium]|nr:hypothetical protein [Clostridiales bacterium]
MDMKRLFYDWIYSEGKYIPQTQGYETVEELFGMAKDELCGQLSENARVMLADCLDYMEQLAMFQNEECFRRGMALGVRMTAESFIPDGKGTERRREVPVCQ